eukprot:504133_1
MSTTALLYIFLWLISTSTSYVYIPLHKTWDQARSYCLSDCKSHLASIHSLDDNNKAKALGTDATNAGIEDSIWIGLSNTESGSSSIYTWTDQSKFDFGNATDGNEPWLLNRPINLPTKCIAMVYSNSFLWKDRSCTGSSMEDPFICNECTYTDYNDLKTYYVSKLQLELSQANTYCRNHCHSTIGSIHNEIDFQRIISLSQGTDVFIGLERTSSLQTFSTWLDNTNLDWGRIVQYYPWQSSEPDSHNCVLMDASNIYQWKSTECENAERFVCNSCDGVLNKYILIQSDLSWIDADNYCQTQYGTHLASIHSLDTGYDWNEIITQMNISEIDSVWVGLHDVNNNGNYTWSDGTFFDDTLSIFESLPNGQCVYIDGGSINYNNCNNDNRSFICAVPSEFEIENNWQSEKGIWEHRGQSFIPKNVIGVASGGAYTLISDKQWINKNGILLIEYMFSVTNIVGTSHFKTAGLIIANFKDTICDFYYIAFQVEPLQTSLILVKNINGMVNILQSKILERAALNLMVGLKIIVTNNTNFDIYLNDKLQLSFIDNNFNMMMMDPITSGYIGIHNYDLETISKWLYVSGAKWNINHENGYNKDFSICDVTPKTTTTIEPINTTIAFTTTELISTTKYYTTMKPTIKSAGDKTSIVPTLDDGSGVVNEQTKLTENDNNFNEELNKQNEEFILQLIIFGAIGILICGCIIILIYSLKKYKNKQKQAKIDQINNINMTAMNHTPVSTNALNTLQLSSISKPEMSPQIIPMGTNSAIHVNVTNINKNYMEIDMEGDTPRISTHRKSKTAEFKQMLSDNLYGNQLIMNDIVDDINKNDNNNISNENEEHVTAGGPIINGNENDNDNNHEEGGQQQNDNEYGITKGGPNDDNDIILGNDEFIINGDSDDDNNQHITPMGIGDNEDSEKSEENKLITGQSTAGAQM